MEIYEAKFVLEYRKNVKKVIDVIFHKMRGGLSKILKGN